MKTPAFITVVLVAGGLVAIAALPGPTTAQSPSSGRTIEVDSGVTIELIDNVRVPAQEAGRLMRVLVKGGESVEDGFVLAEIDNRDTLAKQRVAEAEVNVARVQSESGAELELAQKGVAVAQAELDQSNEIRRRNPGAVSETDHRKLVFQHERALAQVKVAQDDHLTAMETVKVKEAQLEATINELTRRQIASPFPGVVNEVFRQVGEWVQPGDPIAHMVRFDRVRVKGWVLSREAAPIDVLGKPVEIIVTAAGNKEHRVKGTIDFASQVIEGTSDEYRTFRVWTEVDNEKIVDPVTKKEAWKIQPGTAARMVIDMSPPAAPKPLKASPAKGAPASPAPAVPGTFRSRTSIDDRNVTPVSASERIETLKPVLPAPAAKSRVR